MRKSVKIALISVGSVLAVVLLIFLAINTPFVQNKAKDIAVDILADKLNTKVNVDYLEFSIDFGDVGLYGITVNDLANEELLRVDTLNASLSLLDLIRKKINIESVKIKGCNINAYKMNPDTATNFQFIIDAFAKKDNKPKPKNQEKAEVNIKKASIEDFNAHWSIKSEQNVMAHVSLQKLSYVDKKSLSIKGLQFTNNNGKPRKNEVNPKRGAFDAGHLDILLDADFKIHHLKGDSVSLTLNNLKGADRASGLDIDSLTFAATANKEVAYLHKFKVKCHETHIYIDDAKLLLPKKAEGSDSLVQEFSFKCSTVHANTILQNISQPFTPALAKFTTPLCLSVLFSGNARQLFFDDIHVFSPDGRIDITAKGNLQDVNIKEKLLVTFFVNKMTARKGIKEQILAHFPLKKSMLGLIHKVGDISYSGKLVIPKHAQYFSGVLGTAVGRLNFNIHLDSKTKYLDGSLDARKIALGKVIDNKDIGNISLEAKLKFDIASKKDALKLHRKFGKLPVGDIEGMVHTAEYKKITLNRISFKLNSDGDVAEGEAGFKRALADAMVKFSFTDTKFGQDLKIKPSINLHLFGNNKDGKDKDKDKDKNKNKDKDKDKDKDKNQDKKSEKKK